MWISDWCVLVKFSHNTVETFTVFKFRMMLNVASFPVKPSAIESCTTPVVALDPGALRLYK
jgi:hypothetical protein